MPVPYEFREYLPGDYDWLYKLREQSYRDVVIEQFGEWDEFDQRKRYEEVWSPKLVTLVVSKGSRIGMFSCSVAEGDISLSEIQISPAHRGRGIGTSILQKLIDEARTSHSSLTLQVLLKNQRAILLYEKIGFKTIHESDTHFVMSIS